MLGKNNCQGPCTWCEQVPTCDSAKKIPEPRSRGIFKMYVSYEFPCKALQADNFLKSNLFWNMKSFLPSLSVRRGWCATEFAQTGSLARISPYSLSKLISVWFWFSTSFPQRGFLQTSVSKIFSLFFFKGFSTTISRDESKIKDFCQSHFCSYTCFTWTKFIWGPPNCPFSTHFKSSFEAPQTKKNPWFRRTEHRESRSRVHLRPPQEFIWGPPKPSLIRPDFRGPQMNAWGAANERIKVLNYDSFWRSWKVPKPLFL